MTIFVILEPTPQPELEARILSSYPNDHLQVSPTQWLVSSTGIPLDIVAKLGIYDPREPDRVATGNALVFATSSYHGRGPTTTWDWVKQKLEGVNGRS